MKKEPCDFCGELLTPGEVGLYKKITGWAQVRFQGGSNSIAMASDPEAWAHSACIDRAKSGKGGPPMTGTLF